MSFSSKTPAEDEYFGFDFTLRLATGETISSASFAIAIAVGADAGVAGMLSGSAVIDGAIVKQLVIDGVAGVTYRLTATVVTSAGQTLVESDELLVAAVI